MFRTRVKFKWVFIRILFCNFSLPHVISFQTFDVDGIVVAAVNGNGDAALLLIIDLSRLISLGYENATLSCWDCASDVHLEIGFRVKLFHELSSSCPEPPIFHLQALLPKLLEFLQ